ncbi:MAG: hypothetical protein ACRCSF_11490 [Mycobacteriaceae bacterium]
MPTIMPVSQTAADDRALPRGTIVRSTPNKPNNTAEVVRQIPEGFALATA